nr:aminotransferase class III-fold pyridoxal phosphate-dependent enzyme [uncultured Gellertiella sp.]
MKFLSATPPLFTLDEIEGHARRHFGLEGTITPLYSERDQNSRLRAADGTAFILKIANADEPFDMLDCQIGVLRHIERVAPDIPVPRVRLTVNGEKTVRITAADGRSHDFYVLSYLEGDLAAQVAMDAQTFRRVGAMQARLGLAMRGYFHAAAGNRDLLWDPRMADRYRPYLTFIAEPDQRDLVAAAIDRFVGTVRPQLDTLRAQVIHCDMHEHNLLLGPGRDVAGIIDFGDMLHGPLIFDLAGAVCDFITAPERVEMVLNALTAGYHGVTPLEAAEVDLLYDLVMTRLAITQLINAYRRSETPDVPNYMDVEGFGAADAMQALAALGRARVTAILRKTCGLPQSQPQANEVEELIRRRRKAMGSELYVFYDPPLHLVRGEGVWLHAADGTSYLDCYNNVPIVGHCQPDVVEAIVRQSRLLNTNTRYLGTQVLDYAERLTVLAGGELSVCTFVNSGSEANDIAWRIARAWTGAQGFLTQDFAYHGITEAIDAVSPSANRTGTLARHVRTLMAPDRYRAGPAGQDADFAGTCAADADRAIESLARDGMKPAAVIVDSAFIANGLLEPVPGYVAGVFDRVRRAGGLCIADEVQSGFGRMGQHFWGYQMHGVVPDIITIGKPAGNGHPIGAVITRPEIYDHFIRQSAFFSTFGGNNVSSAAGLAVLDVIENQKLMENAATLGAHVKAGLLALKQRHSLIGDVRVSGLAIGIELVTDRELRTPAAAETKKLVNLLRDHRVLVGSEGVDGNIIKMRPPLVFTRADADFALQALDRAFSALSAA